MRYPMRLNPKTLAIVVTGVVALGVGVAVGMWSYRPDDTPDIAGFVYPQPRVMTPVTLTRQDGKPFTLAALRGKWTFIYFGYSYCPDVCPTTLAELARVQTRLAAAGEDADNQYIFVSVDPKRDTPAHLGRYVSYFDKKFIGVTGARAALDTFTHEVGVSYGFPDGTDGDNYSVSHTSVVALFDPNAHLHAIFTPPHRADAIIDGFRKIRGRWHRAG